jgi:hypothetical protein
MTNARGGRPGGRSILPRGSRPRNLGGALFP